MKELQGTTYASQNRLEAFHRNLENFETHVQ